MLIEIDDNNFYEYVEHGIKPVWFTASWCGYCIRQKVILEEMKEIKFGIVNSEKAPIITHNLNVKAFPALLIFKEGKEINRYLGLKDKYEIMNILSNYVR